MVFHNLQIFHLVSESWKTLFRNITSSVRIRWARSDGKSRQQQYHWLGTRWKQAQLGVAGLSNDAIRHSGLLTLDLVILCIWVCVSLSLLSYRHHMFTQLCPGGRKKPMGLSPCPCPCPHPRERSFPDVPAKFPLELTGQNWSHPLSWINSWQKKCSSSN